MIIYNSPLASVAIFVSLQLPGFVQGQATTNCPLLGPVFPAPTGLAALPAIKSAQATFPGILQAAIENELPDNQTTSFSINIFSGFDDVSIFNYHFAAPGLNGSLPSGTLDNDTIYRLGSVSKLFTAYTFLDQVGFTSFQGM
jgi:CubicO group peptidase (beta-lactamase class C family)